MKEIRITIAVVLELDVSDDTDLNVLEMEVQRKPGEFIERESQALTHCTATARVTKTPLPKRRVVR
jgi:hypothetical protein